MRDKTHFSFLIAFSRQLEAALTVAVDDDVSDAVESLGDSLDALLALARGAAGEELGGDLEGIEEPSPSGDGPPLGGSGLDDRVRDIEQRLAASVDLPQRRRLGSSSRPASELALGRKQRRTTLLKKKGARRGKK